MRRIAPTDDLSIILRQITAAVDEAKLLLLQQKEMTESNLSDLQQRTDGDRLDRLKKETAKLRLSIKKSKNDEKRRRELEKKREQFRKSLPC